MRNLTPMKLNLVNRSAHFALLALLTLFAKTASAGLSEPDNLLYGCIALDNQVVTSGRTDVVIEARRTLNGPAIARYRMGSNARLFNFYALRLSLESLPPVTSPNASQTGQQVTIVVTDASGLPLHTNLVTIAARGTVQRMDFGVFTNLTGFAAWEHAHAFPPGSGNLDSDGDGISNADEYLAGTNPNDPNSKFALSIAASGGGAGVSFLARRAEGPGYEGRSRFYAIESTTNLAGGQWKGISNFTNILGNNQSVLYETATTNSPAFYRGRVSLQGP